MCARNFRHINNYSFRMGSHNLIQFLHVVKQLAKFIFVYYYFIFFIINCYFYLYTRLKKSTSQEKSQFLAWYFETFRGNVIF